MRRRLIKVFLGLFFTLFCGVAMADENVQYVMYVNLSNGTSDEYIVSDQPTVKFDKDYVYVNSESVSAKYATSTVKDYTFAESKSTDIEQPKIDEEKVQLSVQFTDGNTVKIRGMKANGDIRVYSVEGKLQNAEIARIEKGADVSIASLPQGTYIINIGNEKTIKVFKK